MLRRPKVPMSFKKVVLKAKWGRRVTGCVISLCTIFCLAGGEVTEWCHRGWHPSQAPVALEAACSWSLSTSFHLVGVSVTLKQPRKCGSGSAVQVLQGGAKHSVTAIWLVYCLNSYQFSCSNCYFCIHSWFRLLWLRVGLGDHSFSTNKGQAEDMRRRNCPGRSHRVLHSYRRRWRVLPGNLGALRHGKWNGTGSDLGLTFQLLEASSKPVGLPAQGGSPRSPGFPRFPFFPHLSKCNLEAVGCSGGSGQTRRPCQKAHLSGAEGPSSSG